MTTHELNELLGQELGCNPYGEPVYSWAFSEELKWPAYATGKMVETQTLSGLFVMKPEYRQDRMTHKLRHQWLVTKWFAPEELTDWHRNFPGADYPTRGYRINTDWYNDPGKLPNLKDTQLLIWSLRQQLGMKSRQLTDAFEAEDAQREKDKARYVDDAVLDCVPAFVNGDPGKRGGHVSFGGIDEATE